MSNHLPGHTSGMVFCATGIALLVLYSGARIGSEIEREQTVTGFDQARVPTSPYPDDVTSGSLRGQDLKALQASGGSAPALPAQQLTGSEDDGMSAFFGSDSLPIALLRISRVGLEVPVYADTSERNLNRGAGWVEGTAAPNDGGNIAIAAHNDGYFRVLKDIAVGDVLELESIERLRAYRVIKLSIVEPDDISPLSATDTAAVTLVTWYPFYFVGHAPQRYIVRAVAM